MEHFAEDIPAAKEAYSTNVYAAFPTGSALGPSRIRLWQPVLEKIDTFSLNAQLARP